jgi:hypothetical protein
VQDSKLTATLDTIKGSKNPEIHHFHYGCHPGPKWYIKTILPGPKILNEQTMPLFAAWRNLANKLPASVRLSDIAFDWQGCSLQGWWTIWLDNSIDITWGWDEEQGLVWKIVDFDDGLKQSIDCIEQVVSIETLDRQAKDDSVSYQTLKEIIDFLGSYTSEKQCQINRKNLRILSQDEIYSETTSGK